MPFELDIHALLEEGLVACQEGDVFKAVEAADMLFNAGAGRLEVERSDESRAAWWAAVGAARAFGRAARMAVLLETKRGRARVLARCHVGRVLVH